MRVMTAAALKAGEKLLEIEVANTPMNRAAYLDINNIVRQKTLGEDAKTYIIGNLGTYWKIKDPFPGNLALRGFWGLFN